MNRPTGRDFGYYNEDWSESEEPAAGGGWPERDYHGCTIDVAMVRWTSSNKPMVSVAFTHPTRAGKVWKNLVFEKKRDRLGWIKKELRLMGLEIGSLRDLPDRVSELEGNRCSIRVKHKGDFVNVYVTEAESEETSVAAGFDAGGGDDDIPF